MDPALPSFQPTSQGSTEDMEMCEAEPEGLQGAAASGYVGFQLAGNRNGAGSQQGQAFGRGMLAGPPCPGPPSTSPSPLPRPHLAQSHHPRPPLWGRWLDWDTNGCLNLQRIGESMQRPLELCSSEGLEALPTVGTEYQQGYNL
ncbi:hypothetical protein QJQ45_015222 [Haematococcus lacustris]|nr:hypothetical protein QJQ45_015222 [Haematococcus lacustris]